MGYRWRSDGELKTGGQIWDFENTDTGLVDAMVEVHPSEKGSWAVLADVPDGKNKSFKTKDAAKNYAYKVMHKHLMLE